MMNWRSLKTLSKSLVRTWLLIAVAVIWWGSSGPLASAEELHGKITGIQGRNIIVRIDKTAGNSVPKEGDKVEVSYRIGEDTLAVGVWRVSRIVDGESLEAEVEKAEGKPNIGMDALVHASGAAAGKGKSVSNVNRTEPASSTGKATLGLMIQNLSADARQQFSVPSRWTGVFVVKTKPGSAAEKAGIMKEDIIVSIDNEPVADARNMADAIQARNPGDTVTLVVLRNGRHMVITATLDKKDSDALK
ncbi:MAG: S1C family serine protease [Thermodesulfovibrionales bacterium]